MKNVININDHQKDPNIKIDFINMLFNKKYRKEIYDKYDRDYKSTSEEDAIFEEIEYPEEEQL